MSRITIKQRIIILITLITAILIGVTLLVVRPAIQKILQLKKEINVIEGQMEASYQNATKLRRTVKELETIKAQAKRYSGAMIVRGEELNIITELESLAQQYQLEQTLNAAFSDVKSASQNKPALPEYYEFAFLINGPFSKEIDYLSALEKLPYYIIVNNIKFENRQGHKKESDPMITLSFKGIVYVKPTIKN